MTTPDRKPEPTPEPPGPPLPGCPICGDPLERPAPERAAQAPPWLCVRDARGWEDAELTAVARKNLRPGFRDFGDGLTGRFIADQVAAAAQQRRRTPVGS